MTDFSQNTIVLGIETSGTTGGAALLRGDHLLGSLSFTSATLYSQRLLPSIEWLVSRTGIEASDIGAIAVSRGPGSFTGIRIGMSVAKALAYANDAAVVGISTLEALALRAASGTMHFGGANICTLLDARQGEVYAGLFRVCAADPAASVAPGTPAPMPALERVREDYAGKMDALADWITTPTFFAGEGALKFRDKLVEMLGANFMLVPSIRNLPGAEEIAWLGAQRLARGERDDLVLLEPDYLRRSYTQRQMPAK